MSDNAQLKAHADESSDGSSRLDSPSSNSLFSRILISFRDWFGWSFRLVFFGLLGFLGYSWLHPGVDVSKIPFAELTLSDLFGAVFAWIVAGWSLVKMFRRSRIGYEFWAMLGGIFLALAAAGATLYVVRKPGSPLSNYFDRM